MAISASCSLSWASPPDPSKSKIYTLIEKTRANWKFTSAGVIQVYRKRYHEYNFVFIKIGSKQLRFLFINVELLLAVQPLSSVCSPPRAKSEDPPIENSPQAVERMSGWMRSMSAFCMHFQCGQNPIDAKIDSETHIARYIRIRSCCGRRRMVALRLRGSLHTSFIRCLVHAHHL